MLYDLLASRGALLATVLVGFACSLAIGAEFELLLAMEPTSDAPRPQRLEFEELLALSGLFSLFLAAVAFVNRKSAIQERRARTLVESEAMLDPLTGLANRRHFNRRLESALARNRSEGIACALLLIDLDRFKQVNDTFGHSAGDALLVEVARRIRSVAAAAGDAARLGGDEFALILERESATRAGAEAVLAKLKQAIGLPIRHDGRFLYASASIGIAFARPDASRAADLLEAADQDMYRTKRLASRSAAA